MPSERPLKKPIAVENEPKLLLRILTMKTLQPSSVSILLKKKLETTLTTTAQAKLWLLSVSHSSRTIPVPVSSLIIIAVLGQVSYRLFSTHMPHIYSSIYIYTILSHPNTSAVSEKPPAVGEGRVTGQRRCVHPRPKALSKETESLLAQAPQTTRPPYPLFHRPYLTWWTHCRPRPPCASACPSAPSPAPASSQTSPFCSS